MNKQLNVATLDIVACVPIIISTQFIMIENTYLVQFFQHTHNNDRNDNFRKKQDILNVYVMNDNDNSSNNNNSDTSSS